MACQLALYNGPDQLQQALLACDKVLFAAVARDVQKHDLALLPRLVKMCQAGEVDEIAEIVSCILRDF